MQFPLIRRVASSIAERGAWAVRVTTFGTTQPPTPRSQEAMAVVRRYTVCSIPSAFIPVPMLDISALVLVQMLMLRRIARVYGVPFSKDRAKLIVSSLLLGVPQAMSGEITAAAVTALPLMKGIPGIGTVGAGVAMSLLWSAATWALGLVFIDHFETGGSLFDFDVGAARSAFEAQVQEEVVRQARTAPDGRIKKAAAGLMRARWFRRGASSRSGADSSA